MFFGNLRSQYCNWNINRAAEVTLNVTSPSFFFLLCRPLVGYHKLIVCLTMWSLELYIATFRLLAVSLLQAMRVDWLRTTTSITIVGCDWWVHCKICKIRHGPFLPQHISLSSNISLATYLSNSAPSSPKDWLIICISFHYDGMVLNKENLLQAIVCVVVFAIAVASVTAAVLRNGRFNCIGDSSSGQRTFERNLVM